MSIYQHHLLLIFLSFLLCPVASQTVQGIQEVKSGHCTSDCQAAVKVLEIDSDGNVGNRKKKKEKEKETRIKKERVVAQNSGDCDFDVVTMTDLMQMKLEKGGASGESGDEGRTTFEEHYLRWNKPVLVLGFVDEQYEWWEKLKDTLGKESWIRKTFEREPMVAGIIPYSEHDISAKELKGTKARGWWKSYPEKFDHLPPIKRTRQTFLRQIKSYESIRLKAKGKEMSVMDARKLSVPPAYLYHNVNIIKRPNRQYEWTFITSVIDGHMNKRYQDKNMGNHLLSKLGNFTPSLLPSYRTQLRTAQFYYGNYGRWVKFEKIFFFLVN